MMPRPIKDNYYLHIAQTVSERSTCLKRHYGCVIVKDNEIISTGYNGSPRGEINCCDVGKCNRMNKPHNSGDYSDCQSVHAEQNAMLSASRKEMLGATMYIAGFEATPDFEGLFSPMYVEGTMREIYPCEPCPICMRMIKNAGIKRIVTTSMNLELYKEE